MKKHNIPFFRPTIEQEEINAVTEVLQSGSWAKLVDDGPISNYGASNIIWSHEVNEKSDDIKVK